MTILKAVLHSFAGSDPFGNEYLNVFGYDSQALILDELNAFADAFLDQVLPDILDVLSDDMKFTRLEVYNVSDGVGYVDRSIDPVEVGVRTGNSMPRFVAWGFKYQRDAIGKRSGGKRFGKLVESDQDNGLPTEAFEPTLAALASTLGSPLMVGIIETWFPVILERKPAGVYPWTKHDIAGVVFDKITSQNTRKR